MTPELTHIGAMLGLSNGLMLLWGFVVDPLLTGHATQQAKDSRRMQSYHRGVLAAAGTIRTIAARPELAEFKGEPADVLLAVARGFEQAVETWGDA